MKLSGGRVTLRDERAPSDEADLFWWLNLEEWNYYDEPDAPFQPVNLQSYLASLQQPKKPIPGSHTWQVDTVDGRHIGWVNYYEFDEQTGTASVGICLPEPETWGKGFGAAALNLLTDHLFKNLWVREIRATTWTGNLRMRFLAEKCGFKEIGRSPHRVPFSVRREPLELITYSLIAEERRLEHSQQN